MAGNNANVVNMGGTNCTVSYDTASRETVIRIPDAGNDVGGHVAHTKYVKANADVTLPGPVPMSLTVRLTRPLKDEAERAIGAAKMAKRAARGQ